MSIIQHRDNVITLPIVADDNECRPIFSNNRTRFFAETTSYRWRLYEYRDRLRSSEFYHVWSIMGSAELRTSLQIITISRNNISHEKKYKLYWIILAKLGKFFLSFKLRNTNFKRLNVLLL